MHNNCYFNPDTTNTDIINLQGEQRPLTSSTSPYGLQEYGATLSGCTTTPDYGVDSLSADPEFMNAHRNDFHLIAADSPCVAAGAVLDLLHYETGLPMTLGPDYDYLWSPSLEHPRYGVNIGAYET